MSRSNAKRAKRAKKVLQEYAESVGLKFNPRSPQDGDGWETVVVDLLADIQHLFDTPLAKGELKFLPCVQTAHSHFVCERDIDGYVNTLAVREK